MTEVTISYTEDREFRKNVSKLFARPDHDREQRVMLTTNLQHALDEYFKEQLIALNFVEREGDVPTIN